MDTPVASILPEWDDLRVLESIGPNGAVLRRPRTACTLRYLLTHTSGLAYETFHPTQWAYQELPGSPHILDGTKACFSYPLMFDPGTDFIYGISIDWAGRMVERIDGRTIDRFCHDEIFEPLAMLNTTFEVNSGHLADVKIRHTNGEFEDIQHAPPANPEEYGMGHALYSTAPDYLRFLRMVLNHGELDGHRVLGPKAVELMTTNQMGEMSVPRYTSYTPTSADVDLFPGTRMTWTAAFLRNETAIPGRRAAGSLTWSGFLNTHYWIDPTNDLTAVLMTQMMPFCDPPYMATYETFERAAYRLFTDTAQPAATSTTVVASR
jgi:CubicO group peptidase (beta-lactamase class C family)